jgi:hypothetical protein
MTAPGRPTSACGCSGQLGDAGGFELRRAGPGGLLRGPGVLAGTWMQGQNCRMGAGERPNAGAHKFQMLRSTGALCPEIDQMHVELLFSNAEYEIRRFRIPVDETHGVDSLLHPKLGGVRLAPAVPRPRPRQNFADALETRCYECFSSQIIAMTRRQPSVKKSIRTPKLMDPSAALRQPPLRGRSCHALAARSRNKSSKRDQVHIHAATSGIVAHHANQRER